MRNVFDANVNKKSTIECPDFLISILKSPTPGIVLGSNSGIDLSSTTIVT
jgi:hypothetical protein